MNFTNKTVIVAGGTGALGRAVALQFLEAGATITVTYRKQGEYDALAAAAGGYAARLNGQMLDVTDESSTKQFVNSFVERQGHVDVLVNSVGGYAGGQTLWEADARVYEQMMALNLRSGYVLARAVVPVMVRQKRGWIVNVASKAGDGHSSGSAGVPAAKAGGP